MTGYWNIVQEFKRRLDIWPGVSVESTMSTLNFAVHIRSIQMENELLVETSKFRKSNCADTTLRPGRDESLAVATLSARAVGVRHYSCVLH